MEETVIIRGYVGGDYVRSGWSTMDKIEKKYFSVALKLAIHGRTWISLPKGARIEFILV